MLPKPPAKDILEVRSHLLQFAEWFNAACGRQDLEICIDPTMMVTHFDSSQGFQLGDTLNAFRRLKLHHGHVNAAVEAIAQTVRKPRHSGVVMCGEESSTIETAMAMMLAAPTNYRLSGIRYAPLYLTANRRECLDRARAFIWAFLTLFGNMHLLAKPRAQSLADRRAAVNDMHSELTLSEYLYDLRDPDAYSSQSHDVVPSVIAKLVPGGLTENLERHQASATARGHDIMVILDHSLFPSRTAAPLKPHLLERSLAGIDHKFISTSTPGLVMGVVPELRSKRSDEFWHVEP